VEEKAKSAGHTVSKAAGKAKIPLVAGGAAIAGAAGGLALASRQGHRSGIASALRRPTIKVRSRKPRIKVRSRDVAKAARGVGDFGTQMGELATELKRARETADGRKRHRSPVEVVLQGLTARR
jgi:hypothetical protein